jgi:hypothetical protein
MNITITHLKKAREVMRGRINHLIIMLKQNGRDIRSGSRHLCYLTKPYAEEIIALKAAQQVLEESMDCISIEWRNK